MQVLWGGIELKNISIVYSELIFFAEKEVYAYIFYTYFYSWNVAVALSISFKTIDCFNIFSFAICFDLKIHMYRAVH